MKGLFITFEGGDASGKTTAIDMLLKELENKNIPYIKTREPGGVEIAEQIRNIILDVNNTDMTKETEALLYAASRMQHLSQKVIPALSENKMVICDRYLDSSMVYQGYARGLGIEKVLSINIFAQEYMPDITFFLDIKPQVALKRLKARENEINRLDLENIDFHNKVYEAYLELCHIYPNRIVRVDATLSIEKIAKFIINKVLEVINKNDNN